MQREWSVKKAFDDYIENMEDLEESIENWMESAECTDYEYARRVTVDAEWEMWDMSIDLLGWLEDLSYQYDVDYEQLSAKADNLLMEQTFRTLTFDEQTKTLS